MLTRPQVQRYAAESGLRDIMIAEKEVVLTYMLQLMAERGLLDRLAFKGGTCIRKMIVGSQGRFSTDLDFTALEPHDHEDIILEMMAAFEAPYHGLQFAIPDGSYYETQDGLSWGVNPTYVHDWNRGGLSEIKLQVSRRETPTIPAVRRPQCDQSYFKLLPFSPMAINCLTLPEILAEKIRACYQRNKARDMYDLGIFATKPHNQALVRRLTVLKLWQARDSFDPERLLLKFSDSKSYDWDDLAQLVRRSQAIDPAQIIADCLRGYRFLAELSSEERQLTTDRYQREVDLWERLRSECLDFEDNDR
jgi:predicted nucleotidyltransferase component of viral defense system